MFQQEGHPVLHVARVDDVVVVEHQHDIARDGVEVVKESDQARLVRRLGRLQERERTCTSRGRAGIQRGDKVRPEQRGIVVALVEREPRNGPSAGRSDSQPLRQQRRLAEPSRSRHQGQRRLRPAAQALAQSRTRHQVAPPPGDVELRLEQWARHDHHPSGGSRVVPAGRPRPSGHVTRRYAEFRRTGRRPPQSAHMDPSARQPIAMTVRLRTALPGRLCQLSEVHGARAGLSIGRAMRSQPGEPAAHSVRANSADVTHRSWARIDRGDDPHPVLAQPPHPGAGPPGSEGR